LLTITHRDTVGATLVFDSEYLVVQQQFWK
jgi:hypothetical protein